MFQAHVWLPEPQIWWIAEIPAENEADAGAFLQEVAYAWGGVRGRKYVFAVGRSQC